MLFLDPNPIKSCANQEVQTFKFTSEHSRETSQAIKEAIPRQATEYGKEATLKRPCVCHASLQWWSEAQCTSQTAGLDTGVGGKKETIAESSTARAQKCRVM